MVGPVYGLLHTSDSHIVQAIMVHGYVPGLVTSILLLPYAAYGLWSIWLVMSGWEILGWGIAGVAIMVVNLRRKTT